MVYYGHVLNNNKLPTERIYQFLQKSLMKAPQDFPVRGPKKNTEDKLVYKNSWQGGLVNLTSG